MDDLKSIISLIDTEKDNAMLVTEYANKASLLLNSSTMKEINEKISVWALRCLPQ
jgi:hypothetical protein